WTTGSGTSFELAEGTYTGVQVRSTDVAGNVSAPAALGPVTIDVTIISPTIELASDTGGSGTDGVTSDGTVTVGGLEPGATFEYSTDGGTTWTAGSGGSFELAEGTYTDVQVRSIDGAGNVSTPAALGPVTVDTSVAALSASLATDSGASPSDRVTNDATIVIGNLEAGATWQYSLDGGTTWATGTGTSFELVDGVYTGVQVRQTDLAGNVSTATTLAPFTIDTAIVPLSAVLVNDTGASGSDGVTSDGTILVGDLEPGATWQYSTDGGVTWVAGTGNSFALAEGVYTDVQVRQTDVAGNVSTPFSLGAVTVDNTVPGPLTIALVNDTGISGSDQITSDGRVTVGGLEDDASFEYSLDGGVTWQVGTGDGFTLAEGTYADVRVRQIDLAGNGGGDASLGATRVDASAATPAVALVADTGASGSDGVTNNGAVAVSGLEAGARFEYSLNGGTTWLAGSGTGFTLAAGTYTGVQVRQIDVAGNVSAVAQLGTVTVDTTVSAPTLALAADTGTSPTDLVTSDGTVVVGALEAGASWEYSIDGGTTWLAGTGTSFELTDGTYASVQVRQTDVAGNVSTTTSLGPIVVETMAGDLTVSLENDTGASAADGVTNDGTVLVGAIEAGATFQYSLDGGATWQAGTGSSFELAPGTYTDVQVRQVDGAGNIGAATSLGRVTVDTTLPGALTPTLANDTGVSGSDRITSNGAVTVGGIEPGARFEYSTNGGVTWQAGTGNGFTLTPGTYTDVQVRQTDLAGNLGPATSLGAVTVDVTVAPLTVALVADTGVSGTDRITSDATVAIGNLEAGATWQYSLNGGASWVSGTGGSFELADGTYANVQVRQIDRAGNVSSATALAPVTVDTTIVAPTIGLVADTGTSPTDRVTNDATVTVGGIEAGATWQYSLNGGATWLAGSGGSFELPEGVNASVQVRQTDLAGNVSAVAVLAPVTVDTIIAAPTLGLVTDTGTSATDRITSDGTVVIGNLEAGATWQYSTNGGTTWINGTGTSFELAEGTYSNVQVRQTDRAGNVSAVTSIGAVTIDFPDAVNDVASLNMGAQTSVTRPSATDGSVTVVGLLESDIGADETTTITVPTDRTGSVRIEVSQAALVAVADAFRLDVIDAQGNVVYSAVTQNSLVGDVAGLNVLGLTGDNRLVAIVEGLPPGDYRVVVRNDESTLARLLDTDGGGVSLTELGQAGVVLGPQNQTLVLDAVEQALGGGVLGATARGLLSTTLGLTTNLGVGGLVGILTTLLSNPLIGAPQLLNSVLGAVSNTLLSNTLTLLQSTSVTTQVTEYEYANETLSGNAILGNAAGGRDDLGGGAVITQITNSDGTTIGLPGSGTISIAGEYGVLTISSSGAYSYEAYGNPNSVGRSDVFTYTLSDGVVSDTATITIGLQGTAVSAGDDVASAAVRWVNAANNEFFNASGTIVGVVLPTTYDSARFVIGNNQAVTGSATIVSTATVAGNGTLLVQELVGTTWTTVRSVNYTVLAGVLGEVARIDLSTLGLDAGTYRVQATLRGVLSAVTVNTDVNVTYLDQFVHNGSTNATGNILTNDHPGSLLTELEVYNRATGTYRDVDIGNPVTVNGLYGALTLNADGSYVYRPFDTLPYFNTPRVDSFDYHLVHPSGQVAEGTLDVTVRPNGAGVTSTFQASAFSAETGGLETDSVHIDSLLATASADEHAAPTARSAPEPTGITVYDMFEGQGTLESVLDNYLKTSQSHEDHGTSAVPNPANDASDTSIAAVPEADPLGYLVLHPNDPNADQWHNQSLI
ncbi:beta strand repeat-containing protein, partial [Novosphingobium gossypii]|uniref:beta strand repeat-containing protein n=1 Tax=Novosphingobium gossypii TaxID=1604774 RepID=UPI003D21FE28